MDAIIVLVISLIGFIVCDMDFCTLHTFVTVAISIYDKWINYTNDKATRREIKDQG